MNEQLLVCMRGVRAGDRNSFEQLYLLTKDRVRFFLISKGLAEQDLVELMSDCYVVVFEKSEKFRGDSAVLTWIFGIVNVKCKEFFRKRKLNYSELLELPDRVDFEQRTAISMDIREAVKCLDRREYNIFVYKLCFNLTYEEINRVLRIPVGTLKRSVSEIREKLQLQLKEVR